jgi:chromate reductase, NAD(P)H dehydrogenase (quinone)
MKKKPRILAFAGSLRENSLNKRVLKTAIKGAEKAGAQVTHIDLRDYPMSIYNPDDEEENGMDEHALRLQELLTQHDGLLIASPEYNGSLPGSLKNAIDWASRRNDQYKRSDVFTGKVAAMITASPGSFGGVRTLAHLRGVLTSVGVHVIPTEISVSFAGNKFESEGDEMTDEKMKLILEGLGASLVEMLRKLHPELDHAPGEVELALN